MCSETVSGRDPVKGAGAVVVLLSELGFIQRKVPRTTSVKDVAPQTETLSRQLLACAE
jgi:hypothetical protein